MSSFRPTLTQIKAGNILRRYESKPHHFQAAGSPNSRSKPVIRRGPLRVTTVGCRQLPNLEVLNSTAELTGSSARQVPVIRRRDRPTAEVGALEWVAI
jgi:hypothetical protein